MNKRQLIDDIRQLNPTAQPKFLEQFDDQALAQYLQHLQAASRRNTRIHSWSRPTPSRRLAS